MIKRKEEAIVRPKPLKDFAGQRVIYLPFDSPSRILQSTIKKYAVKEEDIGLGCFYLLKDKIVLYHSLSAPLAALSLERLIASGAKEILLLGFCGSLNPGYRMMNVVSISRAFAEEGTSKHYFSRTQIFYPSPFLKNRVESALRSQGLPFLTGSLVSTDAPYRETESWLKKEQKRKIDLVDMETSAVFALAKFYGIQAAALMVISDELWNKAWKRGFHSPRLEEKIKKYFLPFLEKS